MAIGQEEKREMSGKKGGGKPWSGNGEVGVCFSRKAGRREWGKRIGGGVRISDREEREICACGGAPSGNREGDEGKEMERGGVYGSEREREKRGKKKEVWWGRGIRERREK